MFGSHVDAAVKEVTSKAKTQKDADRKAKQVLRKILKVEQPERMAAAQIRALPPAQKSQKQFRDPMGMFQKRP